MKRTVGLILIVLAYSNAFSQGYDLIVTTNGDSIACRIDSVSAEKVYFEMKFHSAWIHTELKNEECKSIRPGIIDKKLVVLKPGTSFIETLPDSSYSASPMSSYRKNTVYGAAGLVPIVWVFYDINYERLLAVSRAGFIKSLWMRAGSGGYGSWGGTGRLFILGLTMLTGSRNNHIEFGLGYSSLFEKEGYLIAVDNSGLYGTTYYPQPKKSAYTHYWPFISSGYRFQKPQGHLLIRTGLSIPESFYLGFGFCF